LAELWKSGVEKVVVVSNYTSTLDLIETHCKRQKYVLLRGFAAESVTSRSAVTRIPRSRTNVGSHPSKRLGAMLAELWKSGVEKVVVVSNYTSTLDLIETHCRVLLRSR
jgi:SNF2 family DNA or RNA helicase